MEIINFAEYIPELVSVSMIAIFMAIIPGADFVMITRNSIFFSRKAGIFSSLGVSAALWLHITYSIAGLAVIISKSILLFSIIKYLGAAYLIFVGWQTFKSKSDIEICGTTGLMSSFSAFKTGFITNALNPKATVFFLSIFTQVVKPETPIAIQIMYGAIISFTHLVWFTCVAIFLTQPKLLKAFKKSKNTIEKLVGGVLVAFGVKVATHTGS
ncbi:LysE family transporter [Endozoicomonas gorgoniicola]|uniref:LysE family transporter n=1 Tax=Endozoicomonas gorgoniicola TaxID=1234144 RepID=A0ABT3MZ42_9GAMM|nr:LysE family transporter [Endozoicomonas gorgoniicola]MCW7554648.1 LysE family transporter [Endozoicomonas gorgoniicola]